jgi:hypothetical protein
MHPRRQCSGENASVSSATLAFAVADSLDVIKMVLNVFQFLTLGIAMDEVKSFHFVELEGVVLIMMPLLSQFVQMTKMILEKLD